MRGRPLDTDFRGPRNPYIDTCLSIGDGVNKTRRQQLRLWTVRDRQRRRPGQWPARTVMGRREAHPSVRSDDWPEHASVWVALDYWLLRNSMGCAGCAGCDTNRRVKALRAAYRRRNR